MKLLGAVLILSGSFGISLLAIRRLDGRVTALRALTAALDILEHELELCLPSMPDWLSSAADRSPEPAASFFRVCVEELKLQHGVTLYEIWRTAAEKELSMLRPCDIETVMSVGSVLGRYDAESQKNSISAVRTQLTYLMRLASEERTRCGKVYGVLGAAAGFFMVVVLM